jgi:parallel beta-helix repeat protein
MRAIATFGIVLSILISGMFLNFFIVLDQGTSESILIDNQDPNVRPLDPKGVIRINNDTEFGNIALLKGWNGSGTESDPYIIENLTINAKGAGNCIYIGNTTVYFIIRNCSLTGANGNTHPTYLGAGITLNKVINGKIESNNITRNKYGVYLYDSDYNYINNNTCINKNFAGNSDGIMIYFSYHNSVTNNTCNNFSGGIVLLAQSSYNTIRNNTCLSNSNIGISSTSTQNNNFYDNICKWNYWGMYVLGWNHIVRNNSCLSNRIGLQGGTTLGEIIGNNFTDNERRGLQLSDTSGSRIEENICLNNEDGVMLSRSGYNSIANNTIINSSKNGLYLKWSPSNSIEDNFCYLNCDSGIELNESVANIVRRNNCTNNGYGIRIEDEAYSNIFYENFISFNWNHGVYIYWNSPPNRFYHNNIISNIFQAYQVNFNYWDNSEGEGNYWSDYTGIDLNGDCIGDTEIPHPLLGYDGYPFTKRSGWEYLSPPNLTDPGLLDTDGNGGY